MARADRTGNRKPRNKRESLRIPEMGYYIVVTDAEGTEPCYFNGLHKSLPERYRDKLVIKVVEARTQDMIQKCIELTAYEAQYRIPWIVFDRDKVTNFDSIIDAASRQGIHVGWSNPCFEIWMYAYFGKMPVIAESWTCCSKFGDVFKKGTGVEYSKTDSDIYRRICAAGDEEKAIEIGKSKYRQHLKDGLRKPSEMIPCSTVYELVEEIRSKLENKETGEKSEKGC